MTGFAIPRSVEIRRGWLFALLGAVAALAVVITWAVVAYAFDSGASTTTPRSQAQVPGWPGSPMQDARRDPSIMSLTPARLAAGALGMGYALPTKQSGPTMSSVLASMSPQTRSWTRAVMTLTFRQLAAGAAGSP